MRNTTLACCLLFLLATGVIGAPVANYDEARIVSYALPAPLICEDLSKVHNIKTWQAKRRPEILSLFQTEVFGKVPKGLPKPTFHIVESDGQALGGKATRKQVSIWLAGKREGPRLNLLMYIPNNIQKPAPAFLGLNFGGNHTVIDDPAVALPAELPPPRQGKDPRTRGLRAERWQVEKLVSNGFAVATAFYYEIEPDSPEGWKRGVRGYFSKGGANTVFAADEWGAISAWAWGLSRAMDYLQTDPQIDGNRVAVIGHSRLGKTALWAGAQDQRFALVISNNSGEGGASLARRNFGETTQIINTSFPHWFCANYKKYNTNSAALPIDAHLLLALSAPRPVYVASAHEDRWADPHGEFLALKNAEPVWQLFKRPGLEVDTMPPVNSPVGETLGYHIRTGPHDITAYDWDQYLRFASRVMGRRDLAR